VTARGRSLVLLAGALAIAVGLWSFVYLSLLPREQKAAAAKEAREQLVAPVAQPDGGTALVRYDRLLIVAGGETTELGRLPDGAWVISRPFRTRADTRVAEDVVSALQAARLNRVVDEKPTDADLQRYGLEPPRFAVTATAEGVPELTVSGGIENTFDGSVYLRHAGDGRVYAVDGSTRAALERTPDALRARDLLGVRDLGLLGIQLKSDRHVWAVARDPEQPWAFLTPKGLAADGPAISQWVAGLIQQRAEKFLVDSPAERKRTGVEKPAVDATFRRQNETVRVRLAPGKGDTDPVTLLREDGFGAALVELPRAALAALDVPAVQLSDRRVLHFEPAQVERIRFLPEGGGSAVVVQRVRPVDGGPTDRWQIASHPPETASTAKVGTLLYALANLRSLAVEDAPPRDAGLGGIARTVVLEDVSGQVLGTLVLGRAVSRKDRTVWTRNSRGEVVQIDLGRLPALPAGPGELIDSASVLPPGPADAGATAPPP
jgi:hypothetical protein